MVARLLNNVLNFLGCINTTKDNQDYSVIIYSDETPSRLPLTH